MKDRTFLEFVRGENGSANSFGRQCYVVNVMFEGIDLSPKIDPQRRECQLDAVLALALCSSSSRAVSGLHHDNILSKHCRLPDNRVA